MTKVNNFDVKRFDSCLRAALYEKFISNDMGKDNDEIINSTNGRAFIKRSANKCRNYKKRPTLLKFSVPINEVASAVRKV